ncbi:MAG: hypothetical protein NUV57_02565 [archaeon]|nr:hypothetical protein [archaeon]
MAESSPFMLIIMAITAIAILLIAINFFLFPSEDQTVKMQNSLDLAEANEGSLFTIDMAFQSGYVIRAANLDGPNRNVRFECTSAEACASDKITVDARQITLATNYFVLGHFRCKRKEIISDCVVYFGEKPATLNSEILEMKDSLRRGETATLTFSILNNGSLDAVDILHTVEIFLIKKEETRETLILKQNFKGKTARLTPGERKIIAQQFSTDLSGRYLARITVDSEDAGVSIAEKEFEVIAGISSSCQTNGIGRTYLEGSKCVTEHLCTGCEYGYECSLIWKEQGTDVSGIADKTKVYSEKEPEDGACT